MLRFASGADDGWAAVIADVQVIEIPQAVSTILNNDPTLSYDAATGKFYRAVNSSVDWHAARDAAVGAGLNGVSGQLVKIDSRYENEIVRSLSDPLGSAWIGATDETTEGQWHWLDGSAESELFWTGSESGAAEQGYYENWVDAQQPNNGGSTQHYGAILGSTGAWYDNSATDNTGYIIEWDASEVVSNFTFSLTDDAGGRFAIDSSTGEITVADGSLLDYETNTSHNVTVETTDAAGNTYSESMSITIDNGIEPTQSVPGAQNVNENTTLTFSSGNSNAVTVSDTVGSTDSRLQVFISVNDGVLNLSQTTGLSILGGADGSSFMTIHGTESDINAAFEGMTFTPDTNFTGAVTLNMTTSLGADLVGHYEFEGNANDTSVGIVEHGTLQGDATTTIDAERGNVLLLDGDGDSVSNQFRVQSACQCHVSRMGKPEHCGHARQ